MASFFGLGGGSSAKVLEPVMPIQYDRYTSFDGPVRYALKVRAMDAGCGLMGWMPHTK